MPRLVTALSKVCGDGWVRPGGPADAAGGLRAGWVVAPGSTDELARVVGAAAEAGAAVVARGAGTKLDWAAPPERLDLLVDTRRLAGLYHHAAGDLVARVGAGTPLSVVQDGLAGSGQRVALDPPSRSATVGGVLSTSEAGPLRLVYGTPRDLLIGVEFVRPDGAIARSGGSVVKNVAGYDLGKLLCGGYGTLGLITSATLRLHPLPAARCWVLRCVDTPLEAGELIGEVLASPHVPAAIELDLPAGAGAAGWLGRPAAAVSGSSGGSLAVLLEGSAAGVAKRAGVVAGLLGGDARVVREPPPWWGRYPFEPGDTALKVVAPVAELHAALGALRDAVGAAVAVRGGAGVGVVHAALPGTVPNERVEAVLAAVRTSMLARGGSCVVLDAPAAVRRGLDLWGPVPGLPLMRAVKAQFDPERIMAPGRMVGGI